MKILKIHTLEKGWWDKDHIMLHAVFQLLSDFMEQEKPDKIVDWSFDSKHKHAWKEIRSLYRWWTRVRPTRKDPLDDKNLKKPPIRWKKISRSDNRKLVDYDKKIFAEYDAALKKHFQLERKWEKEDQRNLHRLIEIREFLWT
ncbi:MAG: hypothetical protein HQM08_19860 [Candidatus Riflebacteria bacterium]|nr:hypothetical protein [Candidatus Riflebacteria bacterium]